LAVAVATAGFGAVTVAKASDSNEGVKDQLVLFGVVELGGVAVRRIVPETPVTKTVGSSVITSSWVPVSIVGPELMSPETAEEAP
jgi:hypothetical protein